MEISLSKILKSQAQSDLHTVLAIDDVYLSLLMIKEALTGAVNLHVAKSVEDAMKVLNVVKVDLLLLDLEMPNVNGFEFLEHIRMKPEYKKIPVIIVSSNSKFEALERTLNLGIVDYIVKPFNPAILREKVVNAVTSASVK